MRRCTQILSLFIFLFTSIHAQIVESDRIREIRNHIEPQKKMLIVFDVDNTLVETEQELGSDQWFCSMLTAYQEKGFSLDQALTHAVPLYHHVHRHIELNPVENDTVSFIKSLLDQKIPTIALTTRSAINRSVEQLHAININFSANNLPAQEFDLSQTYSARYTHGIIFGGDNDKGSLLISFLDRIGYQPDKIIYIDDKEKHIKSVEKAVESRGIEFVGIRYSRLDEKIKNFNAATAQKQLEQLLQQHPLQ